MLFAKKRVFWKSEFRLFLPITIFCQKIANWNFSCIFQNRPVMWLLQKFKIWKIPWIFQKCKKLRQIFLTFFW
jgi:hypothetical protein